MGVSIDSGRHGRGDSVCSATQISYFSRNINTKYIIVKVCALCCRLSLRVSRWTLECTAAAAAASVLLYRLVCAYRVVYLIYIYTDILYFLHATYTYVSQILRVFVVIYIHIYIGGIIKYC